MRDGVVHYCPILFGYSNYSRLTAPGHRVQFGDIPTATGRPTGTTLGGAGIAISASCAHPAEAMAYATWITSAEVQTGPYVATGGQPGRLEAWVDDAVNAACGGFFRRTLTTMEGAWVRPRIRGYQAFQKQASTIVADYVTGVTAVAATLDDLDELWRSVERAASRVAEPAAGSPADGQLPQHPGVRLVEVPARRAVELQLRHPAGQRSERDLALGS